MIRWKKRARRDLEKLPREAKQRIVQSLESFYESGVGDVKKLEGVYRGMYRLRVEKYRVIFRFDGDDMVVIRVGHRKDVYG